MATRTAGTILRVLATLLTAALIGCTPPPARPTPTPGVTATPTATATPTQTAQPIAKLADLNTDLDEVPVHEYAALLAEGLALGANGIGVLPAMTLVGDWTGTMVNSEFGTEYQSDFVFNQQGWVTDYFQRSVGLPALDLNYLTQEIVAFTLNQNYTQTVRPVASTAEAVAGGMLKLTLLNVVDFDWPTGRTRVENMATYNLALDQPTGSLAGDVVVVNTVIKSAIAGRPTGFEISRATFQIALQKTVVAPGRARRQLGDLAKPITGFDDTVFQASLPVGYSLGANVGGEGSRAVLGGIWAGNLVDPSGALSGLFNMEFDTDGRLIRYVRDTAFGTAELDFKDRTVQHMPDVETLVPLASWVSSTDGKSFNFAIIYLHDQLSEGARGRYMYTVWLTSVVSDVDGSLQTSGLLGYEVLASGNPALARGVTSAMGSPQGNLAPVIEVWRDPDASAAVLDTATDVANLSEATLAGLLPEDLPLGMSKGDGATDALAGNWSGLEWIESSGASSVTDMSFDAEGRLVLLIDADFQTRQVVTLSLADRTVLTLPLASRVEVTAGGTYRVVAVVLREVRRPTVVYRYIETTSYILAPSADGRWLMGWDVDMQSMPGNLSLPSAPLYLTQRYTCQLELR